MAVIVVTRLRLKDPALLDEFFTDAVAAIEQVQKSAGNLGANALGDANNAWWTVSSWQDRAPMRAFVASEPHKTIMSRLDHYCDEATFVDWEQPGAVLPDWQTSHQRLVADGQAAQLTSPSPANQTRAFPAPVDAKSNEGQRIGRPGHHRGPRARPGVRQETCAPRRGEGLRCRPQARGCSSSEHDLPAGSPH